MDNFTAFPTLIHLCNFPWWLCKIKHTTLHPLYLVLYRGTPTNACVLWTSPSKPEAICTLCQKGANCCDNCRHLYTIAAHVALQVNLITQLQAAPSWIKCPGRPAILIIHYYKASYVQSWNLSLLTFTRFDTLFGGYGRIHLFRSF
jgi:hypothetical protein